VLTRKDLGGTVVAALVVLTYVANTQDWWYLGSNRWAAVTMTAIAAVGCPLGARMDQAKPSVPLVALGLLGVAVLVLAIVAIVSATQGALLVLTVLVVALWAGTTLRHGLTPPRRLVAP
jgi:hypothetical protein